MDRICHVIRPDSTFEGKQGLTYGAGIAAETTGSLGICMHLLTIPPGGQARTYLHRDHETAIYMLSCEAETRYGDALEHGVTVRAGEFLYIPAGVPHLQMNRTDRPCTCVLARTDPNEQESVVLRPDLDGLVP